MPNIRMRLENIYIRVDFMVSLASCTGQVVFKFIKSTIKPFSLSL